LGRIKKSAPPHPKEALYGWLKVIYHFRRAPGDLKGDLQVATRNISCGDDVQLRWLIDKTAGEHVRPKMKWKYEAVLAKALKAKVPSKKLAKFIDDLGGINAGSSKSKNGLSKMSSTSVQTGWGKPAKTAKTNTGKGKPVGWGKPAKSNTGKGKPVGWGKPAKSNKGTLDDWA
jgi:hypothetical protein